MKNLTQLIEESSVKSDEAKASLDQLAAEKTMLQTALDTHRQRVANNTGHIARLETDLVKVHIEILMKGQTLQNQTSAETITAEVDALNTAARLSDRIESELQKRLSEIGKRLLVAEDSIQRHENLLQYQRLKKKLLREFSDQDLAELRKLSFLDGSSGPLRHDFSDFVDRLQDVVHPHESVEF